MTNVHYADLKNCLHIEDIAAATIPDSTIPKSKAADGIGGLV
jgi:hypothetical protein